MVFMAEPAELCYSSPSMSPSAEGGAPVTIVASKEPPVLAPVRPGAESATPYTDFVDVFSGIISWGCKGELM